jgi:toxin YoeB
MVSKKKVTWSLSSLNDKIEIIEYWINRTKSDTYSRKLNELFDKAVDLIASYSVSGKMSNYRNVRIKIVKNYLIFYRLEKEEIQILRIWDGRNDPKKFKLE